MHGITVIPYTVEDSDSDSRELSPPTGAMDDLLERRERALALVGSAMEQLAEATALMPLNGFGFTSGLRKQSWASLACRPDEVRTRAVAEAASAFDAEGWRWLMDHSGMSAVMTADDKREIQQDLATNPLPLTRENVHATFIQLFGQRHEVFRRGVVELFRSLARAYRSHSAFKVGTRLVLPQAFREAGWNGFSSARERVDDLERVLYLLEGQDPTHLTHAERLSTELEACRRRGEREHETDWLTCRWFANGNLHLWLKQPQHVERINALIAEECGASIPHEHPRRTA
ncbi:DUF4942 domain-containing protein [Halomonas sp. E19]|uniref:DUF4942 domain-containing protein n=1 Tax=Halomonas sp. E19 TaxID=3397247 RepID=UPI004033B1BA